MSEETLFSLEVVVEEVCVLSATVPCRLPAIAFRLLDFPTLVVHHIEQSMGKKLKTKLTMDPTVEVPPQLQELKDRWGIFNINKGKSCLFKLDVKTLSAHLNNTPLYIILIDMWPNVPKLVGNSTIPLNITMNNICRDIDNHGVSIPSVHGEKGRYKLYDLMSNEIGYISMGYRLLSLGPGLIPHIPEKATTKVEHEQTESSDVKIITEITDNTFEEIKPTVKKLPQSTSNPAQNMSKIETRKPSEVKAQMTQTEKKTKYVKQMQFLPEEESEVFVSDTWCPPSLFFNSLAEEEIPSQPTRPHFPAQQTANTSLWYEDVGSETSSFASHISNVGVIESHLKFANTQTTPVFVRKTRKGGKSTAARPSPLQIQRPTVLAQDLPILHSLFNELSRVEGISRNQEYSHQTVFPHRERKPPTQHSTPRTTTTKEKENRKLVPKISSFKQPPKAVKKHADCAELSKRVSANVGWLRQEPVYRKKTSKLKYGLTNTLRLRLQQNNPGLYHHLEEQKEWKKESFEKPEELHDSILYTDMDHSNEFDGFVGDELVNKQSQFGNTQTIHQGTPSSPRRKPVPTPRKSKHGVHENPLTSHQQADYQHADQDRKSEVEPVAVEPLNLERLTVKDSEDDKSNGSGRNIQVHMPLINPLSDDDEEELQEDTDKSIADSSENDFENYSEDFEEMQASEGKSYSSENSAVEGGSETNLSYSSSGHSQISLKPSSKHSDHSKDEEENSFSSNSSSKQTRSNSQSDESFNSDDSGDIGYVPSVLETVPKPSSSSKSPRRALKTVTIRDASAYQAIGSSPTTAETKDSEDFKSVTVSVSSIGVSDEAF